jgi:hypothetical protein
MIAFRRARRWRRDRPLIKAKARPQMMPRRSIQHRLIRPLSTWRTSLTVAVSLVLLAMVTIRGDVWPSGQSDKGNMAFSVAGFNVKCLHDLLFHTDGHLCFESAHSIKRIERIG